MARFQRVMTGSESSAYNTINQNFAKIDNENIVKVFNGPNGGNSIIQGRLPNELGYGEILYDANGIPSIYIATDGNSKPAIRVAKPGEDVLTASGDGLFFSSDFNMWKIIHSGNIPAASITPRNTNITLTGNDIGYTFNIRIKALKDGETLTGNVLLNICNLFTKNVVKSSGTWFDDGTNKVIYDFDTGYEFNSPYIYVRYSLRLMAGSYTFNPYNNFRGELYYQIANTTYSVPGGMGGGGLGDGKFFFRDEIILNGDGTVLTPLVSTYNEFVNGDYKLFPRKAY